MCGATNTTPLACESYYLPEHLGSHVDFVTPTIHFDVKLSKRSGGDPSHKSVGRPERGNGPTTNGVVVNLNELESCDTHITPLCLRALYGLWYEPVSAKNNSYGIGESGGVVK